MDCAKVNFSDSPPSIMIPREYNAAVEFIDRHLLHGRGERKALIDENGTHTYADLAERVNRAGNALGGLGVEMETRVMLCLPDTVDFPAVYWGAQDRGGGDSGQHDADQQGSRLHAARQPGTSSGGERRPLREVRADS